MFKRMAVLMLFASSFAMACEKGCYEYEGVCACDAPAEKVDAVVPVSDERPPSDKMPSYQREGIVAANPPSLIEQDSKSDQEKADANRQGKLAAGL